MESIREERNSNAKAMKVDCCDRLKCAGWTFTPCNGSTCRVKWIQIAETASYSKVKH